ncbi:hypothetical protein EPN90_04025 [Patescibacteria group bacterium]|nr:MAG: hypothetical protein EPN90_04025 [Patescibacteria group bacterium]
MKRPIEAATALIIGGIVYIIVVVAYHVSTGTPAIWRLELTALGAFALGALVTRYLWTPRD